MKHLLVVAAAVALMAGCAAPQYKPWSGTAPITQGAGGVRTTVDGMDIWETGDPPRKYRVIGVIDDFNPGGLIHAFKTQGDVVKAARAVGGDAVIIVSHKAEITGARTRVTGTVTPSPGMAQYNDSADIEFKRQTETRYSVIKFVD